MADAVGDNEGWVADAPAIAGSVEFVTAGSVLSFQRQQQRRSGCAAVSVCIKSCREIAISRAWDLFYLTSKRSGGVTTESFRLWTCRLCE